MALRWYATVIDSSNPRKLAAWWAEALDWSVVYEADDECVIIPSWVDPAKLKDTLWEQIGPGLVFVTVSDAKSSKNRLHIDLAPHTSQDRDAEIERLERLGARRVNIGQGEEVSWTVLTDPEGNEFCVLSSRDE